METSCYQSVQLTSLRDNHSREKHLGLAKFLSDLIHDAQLHVSIFILRYIQQRHHEFPQRGSKYITVFTGTKKERNHQNLLLLLSSLPFHLWFFRSQITAPTVAVCMEMTGYHYSIPDITPCMVTTRHPLRLTLET